ncbi:MinD/ParA family protein [Halorubrum ejinorense]
MNSALIIWCVEIYVPVWERQLSKMNHTVAVTGGTRGTGKTTSVVALGSLLSDAGHDVLLVDCDLDTPSLTEQLDIEKPNSTLQEVIAGRSTINDAVQAGPAGAEVLSAASVAVARKRFDAFVRGLTDYDLVICDTGHPFSDATEGALDAADGVVMVSTLDDAVKRNVATLHESLRTNGRPLIGTALTRVDGNADAADWDCELLAAIPESDAVAAGAAAVLDSPSDPGVESYRNLAQIVLRRLRAGVDRATTPNASIWLPQPADPFLTPAVSTGDLGDSDTSSDDGAGARDGSVDTDETPSETTAATGDTTDSAAETNASGEEPDDDDSGGTKLTRRGALAALTAAVGGVSAGILNTRETPTIEGFGYGGAPVMSTGSGAANATTNMTDTGSISAGGVNRTEQTVELVDGGSDEDPTANETETGGVDNKTDSSSVTNTTDPENTNTTVPRNVTDTTDPSDDLNTGQDLDDGSTDTDDSSPTNGGGTGNTGTDDGSGGDDTTDETSPSEPGDGELSTVGYGQGGYGGVA